MNLSDIIASVGVTILLIAFLLNLYKKMQAGSKIYSLLNLVGAALCCLSSYMIGFFPFVILEGVWATVAAVSLFNVSRGTLNNDK